MKAHLQILVLLTILLASCRTNQNYKNDLIANEISSEVHGTSGKLSFVEDKSAKFADKQLFIELNVNGVEMQNTDSTNKSILAIHCASELYKRLDQTLIRKYNGFSIILTDKNNPAKFDKFFFEKLELKSALNAFSNIDNYLKLVMTDDTINAVSLLDTAYYTFDMSNMNKVVKSIIGTTFFRTFHYYDYYNFENKAGTKKFRCFNIMTVITRQDNRQSTIGFLVPIDETDNKIIFIQPID
jgi:hypothetical protein